MPDSDDPRPLTESLDAVLKSLRAPDRTTTSTVFGQWSGLVGEQIARHASPVKIEDGQLFVEVDEPGWATQLRFYETSLIEKLRAEGGLAVDALVVRVKRA